MSRTTADVIEGLDDLSSWDEEELRRGQRRSKRGTFVGRPPKVVPQAIHQEQRRRVLSKAGQLFVENTEMAVGVLADIAADLSVPAADRIKACAIIVERVLGKSPQAIDVLVREPKFHAALEAAIVNLDADEDDDDDIIDAELVED